MKHIIRKILKEENLKQNLKQQVKDYGMQDAAELVGGMDNFLSLMNFESPMDFLHLFDDLNVVQSKEEKDWTLFRYKPKNNIMVYDIIINEVYINYDEIWSVLQSHFDINYFEILELTKRWLGDVYNLRDITILSGRKRTQVV